MDKALVVGLGEVGRALYKVLLNAHSVWAIDGEKSLEGECQGGFHFMHVCFPYSSTFVYDVGQYQRRYGPQVTVIHSTVPVGTSGQCEAVHSPVIGLHPNLQKSLTTFTKFIGGKQASEVARHLMQCGIRCYITDTPEATELMKILSTTLYGLLIEWTREAKWQCTLEDVPFELYTLWTQAYNEGYRQLGHAEFTRPSLIPMEGKIGGHCVLPNLDMLDGPFVELIKERNR